MFAFPKLPEETTLVSMIGLETKLWCLSSWPMAENSVPNYSKDNGLL